MRLLLIIINIATLFSPLKLFVPTSGLFFLAGVGYYLYTYIRHHSVTNMSLLLLSAAVIIFLTGLVSEHITTLMYTSDGQRQSRCARRDRFLACRPDLHSHTHGP